MLAREFDSDGKETRAGRTLIGPFSVACLTSAEVAALLRSTVDGRGRLDIAICNAHTILSALDDPDYAAALQTMTLLNDGIGISLANRFLNGSTFAENLNGTDLVPRLLAMIETPLRIFLLGAREDQVAGAAAHLAEAYPAHEVVGWRNGFFGEDDLARICAEINAAKPDLLLVAMGNPRQEFFITRNRSRLDVPVAIGVGALFDFMSGAVVRAPRIVQKLGLEWLFRLLQEPRRLFRRYVIGIPRFLFAMARIKYGSRSAKT